MCYLLGLADGFLGWVADGAFVEAGDGVGVGVGVGVDWVGCFRGSWGGTVGVGVDCGAGYFLLTTSLLSSPLLISTVSF